MMVSVKDITYAYGSNEVLRGVSFEAGRGEVVGILGNNGAGKSTLITCLNKIRTPRSGEAYIDGRDLMKMSRHETAKRVSYVAQKNELSRITVLDAVLLGRKPYIKWTISQEDIDICDRMLVSVGLSEYRLRYVDELSGGELQKVMLARALSQEPELLLLDEPTSNLDPKNQHETMALVRETTRSRGVTALIVIHDLNLALRYCDKYVFLHEGVVYRYGDEDTVTAETIQAVYGIGAVVTEAAGQKVVVVGSSSS